MNLPRSFFNPARLNRGASPGSFPVSALLILVVSLSITSVSAADDLDLTGCSVDISSYFYDLSALKKTNES